jgi:hypothetical protein
VGELDRPGGQPLIEQSLVQQGERLGGAGSNDSFRWG